MNSKKITSYKSFEERDLDRLKHMASLTPEERLLNLKKMIFTAYNIEDEADLKITERKINFPNKITYTKASPLSTDPSP